MKKLMYVCVLACLSTIFVQAQGIQCVETLEEINIQGRESFLKNGGINFDLIPCLNDNSDHILLFENLVKKYI